MVRVSEPSDLVPLPTTPWDERPTEIPLDVEECRTALWRTRGNITEAAALLKVKASRLRTFVNNSEYLTRKQQESREQLKDIAEQNVYEALTDHQDPGRKDSMSRFVLASIGRDRGYGNAQNTKPGINITGKGRMVVTWDDGEVISGEPDDTPEIIDVTPNKVATG